MALIFVGDSICQICGKPLLTNDVLITFPAFLKYTHPLGKYSDAAFHEACFKNSPDAEKVLQIYSRYRKIWENRPKGLKTQKEIDAWGKTAFAEFQ